MSGLEVSRGAGTAVAAACIAVTVAALAPQAAAAATPNLSVSMTGGGPVKIASVGCGQTAVATVKMADGTPVTHGRVEFTSHLANMGGNVVGTVPVTDGTASIFWIPGVAGQHTVSAFYFDDSSDMRPAVGQTTINAVNLNGMCV
ncbi:hypothetical protein OHB26_26635 [Nocardia sp. NBC_01503]|uniref:hypothetical protein n=1 Tax=Nocardia sp. NBC_01503 TaxID=2975997 RepID=UPI002E7C3003|nr:hypothetical protein [Nocardia sp. NBC_01503]WTL30492.1 hypothetical protein OHB26_26635 [Nocardia sp. NBC_01503]